MRWKSFDISSGRRGFTLIEIIIVVGIIAIIAGIIVVALDPGKRLKSAYDTKRRIAVGTLEKAMSRHLIGEDALPGDALPDGRYRATPICREGVNSEGCVNIDTLVPKYIPELPIDSLEENADVTGYLAYRQGGWGGAVSAYLGDCGFRGLVGYWNFNDGEGENATDASGYGNHAALVNMSDVDWVKDVPGEENPFALSFDGGSQYAMATNMTGSLTLTKMTVTAWVKTTESTGIEFLVYKNKNADGNDNADNYSLRLNNGKGEFHMEEDDPDDEDYVATGTSNVADGAWHHLAGTYDGSTLRVYVDGVEEGDNPTGAFIPFQGPGGLQIGSNSRSSHGVKTYLRGSLDDIHVYNRALSVEDIVHLAGCVGWMHL